MRPILRNMSHSALGALLGGAALVAGVATVPSASAAEVNFTAEVDRRQIGKDESVSLVFNVTSDGRVRVGQLAYDAPDFEVVNEFNSNFVRSEYDGTTGQFLVRNTQKLTKVLRPLRAGTLQIRNIRLEAGGKNLSAPDISVYVASAGAATPPPKNYGGSGVGLRGAGKQATGRNFMIRSEVNKDRLYKGEQLVVSYYLYTKVRFGNLQVDKWPQLPDFLKEQIDTPVMSARLDHERVVLDGVPYDRMLLVRYAAYPLKEGKLRIDPIGTKFVYYPQGGMDDGEDPFMQFFRQMAPQSSSAQSETLTVEVMPLPSEGRPASFSGAVGDFSVTATADRTEVHANEAVNLKVLVQGKGNVAAIGEPKAKWPDTVELYDSKGSAKSNRGVGEKLFEMVLIPRAEGKVSLPGLEFSFFDPNQKKFVTRSTEPIELNVLAPLPGSQAAQPARGATATAQTPVSGGAPKTPATPDVARPETLRYLKNPGDSADYLSILGQPLWRWLYWLAGAAFLALAGWVIRDLLVLRGQGRRKAARSRRAGELESRWEALRTAARGAVGEMPWAEVSRAYDDLSDLILDELEAFHPAGARSLSREDLKRIYVEDNGVAPETWSKLEQVLEHAEAVRFAGGGGGAGEQAARRDLGQKTALAREAVEVLRKARKEA